MKTVAEIVATETSEEFLEGMKNRMVMSFYKYGLVERAYPDAVDALASLAQRLELYAKGDPANDILPGNTEYLMDVANFAMMIADEEVRVVTPRPAPLTIKGPFCGRVTSVSIR